MPAAMAKAARPSSHEEACLIKEVPFARRAAAAARTVMLFERGAATVPLTAEGLINLIPYPLCDPARLSPVRIDKQVRGASVGWHPRRKEGPGSLFRVRRIEKGPRARLAYARERRLDICPEPHGEAIVPRDPNIRPVHHRTAAAGDHLVRLEAHLLDLRLFHLPEFPFTLGCE